MALRDRRRIGSNLDENYMKFRGSVLKEVREEDNKIV